MSTYKSIKGKTIQSLGTDPSDTGAEGQVWFNSTSGTFKSVVASAAWASAAPLSTVARYNMAGTTSGTANAGMVFGGDIQTGPPYGVGNTDEYNGSGWSTGGNLNTARSRLAGAGTLTAGLASGGGTGQYGGPAVNDVEEYNGTAWTSVTGLPVANRLVGGCGIQTAALVFGGIPISPGSTVTNVTLEYNGSTWASGGNLATARYQIGGVGIQTAALGQGGFNPATPGAISDVESYDGTSWTASTIYPTPVTGQSVFGTQTNNISVGGNGSTATNEAYEYDGTSYTEIASTAVSTLGGASTGGTTNSGAVAIGYNGSAVTTNSEEYNKSVNVITAAAWASGGNLNTTRNQGNVAGSQTAGLLFGGETPPGATPGNTEEYNGSTWTTVNSLSNGRFDLGTGSAGTQTAALGAGGFRNDTAFQTSTEEYDGTSWTAGGALPAGRYEHGVFGTQTAGVIHNGTLSGPSSTNTTLEYNGSTWASGGNTSVTGYSRGGAGTLSAGKAVGARTAPSTFTADVEDYDGTSWTAGVNFFRTIQNAATGGTQTATLVGNNPLASPSLYSATFDGTGWATAPSLATARQRLAGTTQLAIAASGSGSEEFTGETSALNVKTLTTS